MTQWQIVNARIVQGHQVASGLNKAPRFPGDTLRMQSPHFLARGLDLSIFHLGTVNVSIAPCRYRVAKACHTFRAVKWHPTEPAEDFSFFDFRLLRPEGQAIMGCIYYPHPETKPEHFQPPDMLELLLPFVEGLSDGMELRLEIPTAQMVIENPTAGPETKNFQNVACGKTT